MSQMTGPNDPSHPQHEAWKAWAATVPQGVYQNWGNWSNHVFETRKNNPDYAPMGRTYSDEENQKFMEERLRAKNFGFSDPTDAQLAESRKNIPEGWGDFSEAQPVEPQPIDWRSRFEDQKIYSGDADPRRTALEDAAGGDQPSHMPPSTPPSDSDYSQYAYNREGRRGGDEQPDINIEPSNDGQLYKQAQPNNFAGVTQAIAGNPLDKKRRGRAGGTGVVEDVGEEELYE